MKTTIKTAWLLLSSIFLLAACSDDRDGNPVIQHPSTFVLDTPAYASSTVTLASTDSLAFSWVQPAFGYQAKVDYQLQISFTGNFTVSTDEAKADASGTTVANYTELPTVYSVTQAKLSAKAFAQTLSTHCSPTPSNWKWCLITWQRPLLSSSQAVLTVGAAPGKNSFPSMAPPKRTIPPSGRFSI